MSDISIDLQVGEEVDDENMICFLVFIIFM